MSSRLLVVALSLVLTACFSPNSAYYRSFEFLFKGNTSDFVPDALIKKGYLKVSIKQRTVALMALGYTYPSSSGLVEVWYSADGEVFHLENGHIIKTIGLSSDLRSVNYSHLNNWVGTIRNFLEHPSQTVLTNLKYDVMPSYKVDINTNYLISVLDASNAKKADLNIRKNIIWFQATSSKSGDNPPFFLGVDVSKDNFPVVMSRFCFGLDYCIDFEKFDPKVPG